VGVAIARVDAEEAERSLRLLAERGGAADLAEAELVEDPREPAA
jgi:hypothetical protein